MSEKSGTKQVKCVDIGNKIDISLAYPVEVIVSHRDGSITTKKIYYSSQEAAEKDRINKEYWTICMDKLMDILGYKSGMKLPTIAAKKLSELRVYGMDVVYDTICWLESSGKFEYALTKDFVNEYNKVSYFCSMIVNNVQDFYNKKRSQVINTSTSITEDVSEEIYSAAPKKKKINISKFLED